ncbi:MAG: hypothetical protein ACO1SV_14530 [Fimbriimonas sp.]
MGALADFFVSADDQASSYDGQKAWPAGDVVNAKSITHLELSTLWAILDGREWEVESIDDFATVPERDPDAWIHRFPAAFTQRLATATPDELQAATVRWSATEEVDADPEDVAPLVRQLQELARNAQASHRSLFLWSSL